MVKRRRRRYSAGLITWVAVGVVVAIVLTIVLVKTLSGTSTQVDNFGLTSPTIYNEVTQVPASVFNTVGVTSSAISVTPPYVLKQQAPLTINGKTGSFYFGAEYCPYCAATRWGMIIALSRFGTFEKLGTSTPALYNMYSSSTDVAPNTPTFTFYGLHYTSSKLAFTGYEVEDRNKQPLMSLPNNIAKLVQTYNQNESFPFMDIDNKIFIEASAFDPSDLAGISRGGIAGGLSDPNNPVTQAIITEANYLTAGICSTVKDPPTSVCHSPGVEAAATALKITL